MTDIEPPRIKFDENRLGEQVDSMFPSEQWERVELVGYKYATQKRVYRSKTDMNLAVSLSAQPSAWYNSEEGPVLHAQFFLKGERYSVCQIRVGPDMSVMLHDSTKHTPAVAGDAELAVESATKKCYNRDDFECAPSCLSFE